MAKSALNGANGACHGYTGSQLEDLNVFDLLAAGGWVMPVIVLCSVIALGISIERSVALNPDRIAPPHLLANVWKQLKA